MPLAWDITKPAQEYRPLHIAWNRNVTTRRGGKTSMPEHLHRGLHAGQQTAWYSLHMVSQIDEFRHFLHQTTVDLHNFFTQPSRSDYQSDLMITSDKENRIFFQKSKLKCKWKIHILFWQPWQFLVASEHTQWVNCITEHAHWIVAMEMLVYYHNFQTNLLVFSHFKLILVYFSLV